ncbi:MAG: tetratricopeptide repeat protein [Bacteroidales bacterium]|nr:tetratricopeptide repeat protein [Bacteroidales bacterium]
MKKILISLTVALATLSSAQAQDIETAKSLYIEAGELLNEGNLLISLPKYLICLDMAKSLGNEADDIVRDCQHIIPQIYMKFVDKALADGDIDVALANYKRFIKAATEYGNNSEVIQKAKSTVIPKLMDEGLLLSNNKNYYDAVETYKTVIELDPKNTTALLMLGSTVMNWQSGAISKDYTEAVKSFTKVAEIAGYDSEDGIKAIKLLCKCYLMQDDYDSAIKVCKKFAEVAGESSEKTKALLSDISDHYLNEAKEFIKLTSYRKGLENAQIAAQAIDSPEAELLIGISAFKLEKYETAATAFEAYLALSPNAENQSVIFHRVADAYERCNNIEKACGYYQLLLKDPKYGEEAKTKAKEFKCKKNSKRK